MRFPLAFLHSTKAILCPLQDGAIRFNEDLALKSRAQTIIRRYPPIDSCLHSSASAGELMKDKRPIKASHEVIPEKSLNVSPASGFHSLESWSGTQTRWMHTDATLEVISPERRTANLSLKALAFYRSRTLDVYVEGELAGKVKIPKDRFIHVTVPVMLAEGTNIIRLHVPEGCERACDKPELNNPDRRCLSVAAQNVTIS